MQIFGIRGTTSFSAATYSLSFIFLAFSLFVFSPYFFTFSCRASSSFFRSPSLSVRGGVKSGNSVSWPSAYNFKKYPSYSWTSFCCTGHLASTGFPPLKGSLGVGGGHSWVGDGFSGLFVWDSQGSLAFSAVVPCLNGSLGVGCRLISVFGLMGGLTTSKSRTPLTFAPFDSSGLREALLFCGYSDTCSD